MQNLSLNRNILENLAEEIVLNAELNVLAVKGITSSCFKYFLSGFPNVIGCIDGSLIGIRKFKHNMKDYISRRNKADINVMVI